MMFMKRLFVLLCALASGGALCFGQQENVAPVLPAVSDNFIPPSPDVTQMLKYVDLPVTHSLGLVDISIPIYTVEGHEMELPISISYHASGIKLDDKAGCLGLGWTLNASGVVGREVKGIPDDAKPQFKIHMADELTRLYDDGTSKHYKAVDGAKEYIKGVVLGNADSYYDMYRYTYPGGGNGSFMIDKSGNPVMLCSGDDAVGVNLVVGANEGTVKSFQVQDPNGNTYLYDQIEMVHSYLRPLLDWTTGGNWNIGADYKVGSSWHLSKITSCNGLDSWTLYYDTPDAVWENMIEMYSLTYLRDGLKIYNVDPSNPMRQDIVSCELDPYFTVGRVNRSEMHRDYYDRKILSRMDCGHCSIEFEYERGYNPENPELESISIYDVNGNIIRKVEFQIGQFGNGERKLDAVRFIGSDGTVYDTYEFSYYDQSASMNRNAQDRFGYYNGKNSNTNLLYKCLFEEDAIIKYVAKGSSSVADYGITVGTGIIPPEDMQEVITDAVSVPFRDIKSEALNSMVAGPGQSSGGFGQEFEEVVTVYEIGREMAHKRDYSLEHAVTYSLQSVTTARGDKTVFKYGAPEWEYTDADTGEVEVISTGIRIDSIETYDRNGVLQRLRRFEYSDSGCTIDFNDISLKDYMSLDQNSVEVSTIMNGGLYNYTVTEAQYINIGTSVVLPGANPDNAKVFYNKVREIISDGTGDDAGRAVIDYVYDCDASVHKPTEISQIFNSTPTYARGTERISLPGTVTGFYYHASEENRDTTAYYKGVGNIRRYFMESPQEFGNLSSKTIYKTDADGRLVMTEQENTVYGKFCNVSGADSSGTVPVGLYVQKLTANMSVNEHAGVENQLVPKDKIRIENLPEDCLYFDVRQSVYTTRPLYTVKRSFNPSGNVEECRVYVYLDNGKYGKWPFSGEIPETPSVDFEELDMLSGCDALPQRVATLQPKGEIKFVNGDVYYNRYLYRDNYGQEEGVANDDMWRHVLLGMEARKNDGIVSAVYTKYGYVPIAGSTLLKMRKPVEKVAVLDGVVTSEAAILEYDQFGNPVHITQTGYPSTCYIWGYMGMYPVAVIENATYSEVRSALGASVLKEIGNSSTLSATHQIKLDALRNALPDAKITVYSHKPLVGVASVTDPSGRKTYYQYDGAGRLTAVRDEQGNIVEAYEYNKIN